MATMGAAMASFLTFISLADGGWIRTVLRTDGPAARPAQAAPAKCHTPTPNIADHDAAAVDVHSPRRCGAVGAGPTTLCGQPFPALPRPGFARARKRASLPRRGGHSVALERGRC